MTEIELNNEYFEWMCQLVCNERYSRRLSYQKLLRHLHNIDFQYMLPMDGNRAEDGIDLRYRFGYEKEYEGLMIASYLDNRPCSVLEMLIALAFRCEEHTLNVHRDWFNNKVLDDPKIDWWQMIQLLPSSYNQKRTVMLNYEVLANIYKSRRHHKLDEWHTLCDWIESLPYSELITGKEEMADV